MTLNFRMRARSSITSYQLFKNAKIGAGGSSVAEYLPGMCEAGVPAPAAHIQPGWHLQGSSCLLDMASRFLC